MFSCLVPGRGGENYFVANSIGSFYYATRENKWLNVLQPYLKPWLSPALSDGGTYGPQGQEIAQSWYLGLKAGQTIPWGAWLVPIATWSALILTTYWMWSCLAVMLRAQWAEREALAFPLLQWPLEMTRQDDENRVPPFFRIASFCVLIGWSMAAGIRFDIAFAMWFFYMVCAIALARVVVETGLIYVQQGFTPLGTFAQLFGSGPGAWLAQGSLVPAGFIQLNMMIDLRANLLPSFMHSFKLAQDRGIPLKPLLRLIFATIIVAYSAGIWQVVRMGYNGGGIGFNGWMVIGSPQAAASIGLTLGQSVPGSRLINWIATAFGGLLTYGVMAARAYFSWFPLHPIGLLLCLTHPMFMLWFSIFLGWAIKGLIMRFGGTETYKKALPAFLGLALGDVCMMLFWLIIDGWQGRVGHNLLF